MNIGNEVKFTYAHKWKIWGWIYLTTEHYVYVVVMKKVKFGDRLIAKDTAHRFDRLPITELEILNL